VSQWAATAPWGCVRRTIVNTDSGAS
jgi:hypothetical protein